MRRETNANILIAESEIILTVATEQLNKVAKLLHNDGYTKYGDAFAETSFAIEKAFSELIDKILEIEKESNDIRPH